MFHCRRAVASVVVAVMFGLAQRHAAAAQVSVTTLGSPNWNVVDFNLVSVDSAAGIDAILPPPNHKNYPDLSAGPGAPHAGPYDQEISRGVEALGLRDKSTFSEAEFSNGRSILLAFMLIPDGSVSGSSPDFASGPIIPNQTTPIDVISFTEFADGSVFSGGSKFTITDVSLLDPSFASVEGYSHVPAFTADRAEDAILPGEELPGDYQFRLTLTDNGGSGYAITAPFTITAGGGPIGIPLPAAAIPGLAMLAAMPIVHTIRRR